MSALQERALMACSATAWHMGGAANMRAGVQWIFPAIHRRALLTLAGATLAAPNIAHAQTPKRGGRLLVGSAGGGAKDKLDPHAPVSNPDIARVFALYEPLAGRDQNYEFR